jgi:RHS repeat-associated protein
MEARGYNNRLELTAIQATSSAGTALNLAYNFASGNNGNIAAQTNNVTSGRTETYTYDSLNRLLTAQATAASGADCWGQSFGNGGPPPTMATDALANLFYTSSIKCSSPAPQYTMNTSNNNQFTGTGISYDSAGDMTADTAYTYTYDAEDRIVMPSGMTGGPYCYFYDGDGLRVIKSQAYQASCTTLGTVDVLYWRDIAGNTIAETDGSGSTTNANYHEYIFFAGRRIAQSNPAWSASDFLIGYADDAANNWAATGAWTLRSTATNVRYGLEDQLSAGTGPVAAGFAISSAPWMSGIAAFRSATTNTFVQKKDQYFGNVTGATSESVTLPSNTGGGNLLFCVVGWDIGSGSVISSVSDSRGNTYSSLPLMVNSPHQVQSFYTFNASTGADTFTVNFSGSGGTWVGIACGEWSGPIGLDAHGEATGNSATPTSSSITPSGGASGSVYYYFADHLGNTRVVTNSTGSPCYEADFLPYGTENTPAGFTNTCSTNYKFTGYERDAETAYGTSSGNDYAFARYYNSRLGRFMSADPLGGNIGNPQSLNRYASVLNDPINLVDRLGLNTCWDQNGNPFECPGPNDSITVSASSDTFDLTFTYMGVQGTPGGFPFDCQGLEYCGAPSSCYKLAKSYGYKGQEVRDFCGYKRPQMTASTHRTPWYKNSCITGALANGALHAGIDAIGLIPEGGFVSRTIGNSFNYRGIVADQFGNKILGAVGMATGIGKVGVFSEATSTTGLFSTGLGVFEIANDLAGSIPVVGQIISGAEIVIDAIDTGMAIAKCN